jgi:hypothetical protein
MYCSVKVSTPRVGAQGRERSAKTFQAQKGGPSETRLETRHRVRCCHATLFAFRAEGSELVHLRRVELRSRCEDQRLTRPRYKIAALSRHVQLRPVNNNPSAASPHLLS